MSTAELSRLATDYIITAMLSLHLAACTTPNPDYRKPQGDSGTDTTCTANQALRCESSQLVRCNANGNGEVAERCLLGCLGGEVRCADVAPSNELAKYLDLASNEPDHNLGNSATIDTDSGLVTVDGVTVSVKSNVLPQLGAPDVRVFLVRSLTTNKVAVTGTNAFAVVSNGAIKIEGLLAASATETKAGAGAFNDGNCRGGPQTRVYSAYGGSGGGGFGSPGGSGGSAKGDTTDFSAGAAGGATTGNAVLVPLRGGCDGGLEITLRDHWGRGGGAIQLVSRTNIVVAGNGIIAANGSSNGSAGSGGGILLEAPNVEILGRVVANGAAGQGCAGSPPHGRLDAMPAIGGPAGCNDGYKSTGQGGNGGAANIEADNGKDMARQPNLVGAIGGQGGGGIGRIRVNTVSGGLRVSGVFSPTASIGDLTTR